MKLEEQRRTIEETLEDLRHYIDHEGNPKPAADLLFEDVQLDVPTGRTLDKHERAHLLEIIDGAVTALMTQSQPDVRVSNALSVLQKFASRVRDSDAIVTPIDAFNCIGWWRYLRKVGAVKSNTELDDSIERFLDKTVSHHLAHVSQLTAGLKAFDLLESSDPSFEDKLESTYNDTLELETQVSFAPQALTEKEAFRLRGQLLGCDVIARMVADGLYFLQGREPILVTIHRSVRMRDVFDLSDKFSAEDVREAIRARIDHLKTILADVQTDAVVLQFGEAANIAPYMDEPLFLHALYHFAEPFVRVQRGKGSPEIGNLFQQRLSEFTGVLSTYRADDLHDLSELIPGLKPPELANVPFGYMYHLVSALRRREGKSGELTLPALQATWSDPRTRIVECQGSRLHRFFSDVAAELIAGFNYREAEDHWMKVGLIASSDSIDDELRVTGSPQVVASDEAELTAEKQKERRQNQLDIVRNAKTSKRPKYEFAWLSKMSWSRLPEFHFDADYLQLVAMPEWEAPYGEKISIWKSIDLRADDLWGEIVRDKALNDRLGNKVGPNRIECPEIIRALIARRVIGKSALKYRSEEKVARAVGYKVGGTRLSSKEESKRKHSDTTNFRAKIEHWQLEDLDFEHPERYKAFTKDEVKYLSLPEETQTRSVGRSK